MHFTVQNNLSAPVDENVLVFLMPVDASSDFQFAAWQSLDISTGGSQPFDYHADISVQVMREDIGTTTSPVSIKPGEIYNVQFENLGGITLVRQPAGADSDVKVTQDQCAIFNNLTGDHSVKALWFVNGSPCVAMPGINVDASSIFQLEPTLYFRAAKPTAQGFNYTLQQVSKATPYNPPISAQNVTCTWSRPDGQGGADQFGFNPRSQPPPA